MTILDEDTLLHGLLGPEQGQVRQPEVLEHLELAVVRGVGLDNVPADLIVTLLALTINLSRAIASYLLSNAHDGVALPLLDPASSSFFG